MADPWLVAGLGNPGSQYERTPHNLGFLVVDRLAERNGIRVTRPEAKALIGTGNVGRQDAILAKPQTFMNLSGGSVQALLEKYSIPVTSLLVVYDELDLPWMAVRVRSEGSAGGHNGVKSLIASLGTEKFARLRLGIHPDHPIRDAAEFVLSPFRKTQLDELDELLDYASQAVESILAEGVAQSMTKFNRRARG